MKKTSRRNRMARICTAGIPARISESHPRRFRGGRPQVSGDPAGQNRADSAENQPVEENQGNDKLIPLELS